MNSRQSESLCATVPRCQFLSLSGEIGNSGRSAINNRTNFAVRSRKRGDIYAAEDAEMQAKVMQEIAKERGIRL